MGKVLFYIYNDMADFEFVLASHLLGNAGGKEIVTIAYEDKVVKSKQGIVYQPVATVKDALGFEDVEGLVITGGWNAEQKPELTELIQRVNRENKLLAAICAGPQYLARAGVLEGRSYTTTLHPWTEELTKVRGEDPFPRETFVNQRVVVDGNIITATGIAFVDFAIELCQWFELFSNEEERREYEKAVKGI